MDWIKKGAVTFALSLGKVEKDTLAQNDSEDILRNNYGAVNPYVRNQLMQDLKEGRVTQQVKEFRKKYYEILRKSANYKFKDGQLLSEQEVRAMKVAQGDPFDSYPVELAFDNKAVGISMFESAEVRPLKIQRGVTPRHKIENYTSTVHVRTVDGNNKLLDFYIPKSPENQLIMNELESIRNTRRISDLVNFTKTSFTTQDAEMLVFEYRMLAFDKVVEHNNNYIVKMFAEVTKDGDWVAQKYMIVD